jgi:hypothetical protein
MSSTRVRDIQEQYRSYRLQYLVWYRNYDISSWTYVPDPDPDLFEQDPGSRILPSARKKLSKTLISKVINY